MVDTAGQADIRGIDIQKLATGFGEVDNIFMKFAKVSKTSAREIRWYQKTSGFLENAATTGITLTQINTAEGSLPVKVRQSWTRRTSYVRKFFAETDTMTIEDIKDSDPAVLADNIKDLVRAIERKKDLRFFSVLTEAAEATPTTPNPTTTNTAAATADGWDDAVTGNPIADILTMKQAIYSYGYNPEGAVLAMNSIEHRYLMNFLISVKGSSIPQFASDKIKTGVVMEILGVKVVVSQNWTTDCVGMFIPGVTIAYKSFLPTTTANVVDEGIGIKVRCWAEGEFLLTNPKSAYILTNTSVA